MRKITTYLLMLTFILVTQSLWADVTFKFKAPSSWSKCYLWAWDDNKNQLASSTDWPGDVAMTKGSDGYYTYTLKTSVTKVNFLFNNGASSGTEQTVDYSTDKSEFVGRYGSMSSSSYTPKYEIIDETPADSGDEGGSGNEGGSGDDDDDVVTPDPTGEVTIAAIRNRLSINTKDFKDFAGLYVSALPKAGDATVSYEWQFSSNGTSWEKYSAGDGATWDNIRPNTAGYYRCVLSYDLAGAVTTYTSNTLQITHNGGSQVTFSSKLPVILVRTAKDFPVYPGDYPNIEQVEEFKAKRSVDVKILWNEDGGAVTNADVNNADMLHYDRKARMNYRGSSSLYNPKRSYAFVSGDKNCDPKKLGEVKTKKFGMFGAAAQKDWVLYASYPDATYMRNLLTYHQYSQMTGLWGAKCRYVELYIDGSYQGIYVFMDKITQDENRVNVNEDTGYIVKFDKTDIVDRYSGNSGKNEDYKRNTFTTSNTGRTGISTYNITVDQAFEIEYPEREDLAEFDDDGNVTNDAPWEAKVAEIKGIFENMEKAILANDYTTLATIIDYDSWADYFIMNEFSRNADAYRISCVFTVNSASDKIVANPMWDYELGWGNQDTQTNGLMVEDVKYYSDDFPTPFWWTGKGKSGCNGILGDCKFRAKVLERWEKYIGTNGALNSTVLTAKIDSLQAALSGSSTKTSVSTNSLKSWVTNRTSGLNTEFNTWDACPDLKFALVGTINDEELSTYANGIQFTEQEDGSYTATFTASEAEHSLQIITSTGDIWARNESKDIVSTSEDASSYASMTKGQTTGYANITTVANTEYSFTFKLNGDGVSGKLTYLKGKSVLPDEPISVEHSIVNVTCNGGKDGSISLEVTGGKLPYTYTWTYPSGMEIKSEDIFALSAGVYSLKIEDSVGNIYENTYEVTEPVAINARIEVKDVTCGGYPDGSILSIVPTGATAPYDYSIYNEEDVLVDFVNLKGGYYNLVLTDANGCKLEKGFAISEPEKLELVINSAVEPSAFGASDGFIDITVTGGTGSYTYQWSGYNFEADTEDINGLVSNIYEITVTDENDCSVYERIELSEPAPEPYVVTPTIKNLKCYNDYDGAISLEVSGSVAPYTYTWTYPNGTEVDTKDISGLRAGVYTLKIEDSIGLTYENTYEITEPEELTLEILSNAIIPYCRESGQIALVTTGGVPPYEYELHKGAIDGEIVSNDAIASNLKADVYYAYAFDVKGCRAYAKQVISASEPINIELSSLVNVEVPGESTGEIEIEVTGGIEPLYYEWAGPGIVNPMNQDQYQLPAGFYSVVVTDDYGCEESAEYEIKQPDITTDVEDFDADITINVSNGLITVSDGDLTIYNVIGQDVTIYNGGLLPGVYMVQIGDKSTKVIMK